MISDEVNYCPRCGTPVQQAFRFGRQRAVCSQCGWIHFADPKVAVAVLVIENGKVLFVQRANEPYLGSWTLPAGFVDAGEDPEEAAVRECREETGLEVKIIKLLGLLPGQEHPHGAHILIVYQGEVLAGVLKPGDDAQAAGFFKLNELPPLAFESTRSILERWVSLRFDG